MAAKTKKTKEVPTAPAMAVEDMDVGRALAVTPTAMLPQEAHADPFASRAAMEHYWQLANLFAQGGDLVPEQFRGKPQACLLAIETASRFRMSPLATMARSYMVKPGQPSWYTDLYIAMFNKLGPSIGWKSSIRWTATKITDPAIVKMNGQEMPNWEVSAHAIDKDGELCEGTTVSTTMAGLEGWNKGSTKYQSMPEHMLRFRAAAFWIRQYAPEVMMGQHSVEELQTMPGDDTKTAGQGVSLGMLLKGAAGAEEDGKQAAKATLTKPVAQALAEQAQQTTKPTKQPAPGETLSPSSIVEIRAAMKRSKIHEVDFLAEIGAKKLEEWTEPGFSRKQLEAAAALTIKEWGELRTSTADLA